jgi:hypothetical protein
MITELCIFFLLGSAFGIACMLSFQEARRLRRRMILRKLAQRGWELE